MEQNQVSKLKRIGIFTLAQAKVVGVSQQKISSLVATGVLKRVARGIYLHHEAEINEDVSFQITCAKFGRDSAIGGLTALFHYNLTEQVPGQVWVLVPPERRSNVRGYKLIRTKTKLTHGIVVGKGYRIASVERAVLEGLKFITKIGERTAIKAARDALLKKQTSELKLARTARELGLESVLIKYLEVIVP
jgi:predicted transcriptional regulator of viral defense system